MVDQKAEGAKVKRPICEGEVGGFCLNLFEMDGEFQLWLDTEADWMDGLCLASGKDRASVIAEGWQLIHELSEKIPPMHE